MHGTTPTGAPQSITLAPGDLVVAVKAHCDGCASMLHGDLSALAGRRVWLLASTVLDEPPGRPYLVSPQGLAALELYSAPQYVLLGGDPLHVVGEGFVFSPDQVAAELP